MTVLELQTVAQIFTERLLNTAAEGVVIAGLVWALLRLFDRQNSGTRFAIWFSALLTIVVLPFFGGSRLVTSHSQVLTSGVRGEITLSSFWAFCLFAAWAGGAGLLLLRLSVGLWRVHQIRRNCSDVDLNDLDPAIARILRDPVSRRRVKLCVSGDVAVPAAIGFFRPAIVFPAWLLPQLSEREIEVILLHELAHLHRWDDWTNLAQKIVKAVLFFHPAVWWIEDRLTLEREMACDDIVLAQTASPRTYASSLISFAEKLQNARGLTLVQALVSRMHQLSLRLAQILDAKRPSRTGLWKPVLGLSTGMLAVVLCAAPYMPPVVAFETQPSPSPKQHMMRAAQRVGNIPAQPEVADMAINRSVAERVARQPRLAPQTQAIPAVFNRHTPVVRRQLKAMSVPKPMETFAKAAPEKLPIQETIVILQSTRYGASGSGVWTVCIWRVGGKNFDERQLESAIVVSSI
jgi:beta-lactamase regulating signal transducer with metallopeptidase domain